MTLPFSLGLPRDRCKLRAGHLLMESLVLIPPSPATVVSVPLEAADAINAIFPATRVVSYPIFVLGI